MDRVAIPLARFVETFTTSRLAEWILAEAGIHHTFFSAAKSLENFLPYKNILIVGRNSFSLAFHQRKSLERLYLILEFNYIIFTNQIDRSIWVLS